MNTKNFLVAMKITNYETIFAPDLVVGERKTINNIFN